MRHHSVRWQIRADSRRLPATEAGVRRKSGEFEMVHKGQPCPTKMKTKKDAGMPGLGL
jgi:hypothetical protein